MGQFLLAEVAAINRIVVFMRSDIARLFSLCESRVPHPSLVSIALNEFPREWRAVANLWAHKRLASFTSHVIERHAHIIRCVQEGQPVVFDMRLIGNPRFLLQAFLTDAAAELGIPYGAALFEFKVNDSLANVEPGTIFLTRLSVMCADIRAGRVGQKASGKAPMKSVPAITGKVVASLKLNPSKCFALPLFRQALVGDHGFQAEVENGEVHNFVWNVMLPSEGPSEAVLDQAGATLFCQLPDLFS
jgi:hypothetical protein